MNTQNIQSGDPVMVYRFESVGGKYAAELWLNKWGFTEHYNGGMSNYGTGVTFEEAEARFLGRIRDRYHLPDTAKTPMRMTFNGTAKARGMFR